MDFINSHRLSATILGSGTCVPSLRRSACSVLVETGNDKLLFDAGPGTMRRLLEAGIAVHDVTHLFFSHFHPDHTGELATFLFANKYPDLERREKPLAIFGGKGFYAFFEKLKTVYGEWIRLPAGLVSVMELDNTAFDRLRFDSFSVETAPVEHNEESIAYRITAEGKSVVYSGDTDYSENLIILAENADLLICESAFPDALKTAKHLTPSLAGRIASLAKVRHLVLTHLYPECDDADIKKECGSAYAGKLSVAEDLMKFTL